MWTSADLDTLEKFGLGNVVPGTMVIDEKGRSSHASWAKRAMRTCVCHSIGSLQGRVGPAAASAPEAVLTLAERILQRHLSSNERLLSKILETAELLPLQRSSV